MKKCLLIMGMSLLFVSCSKPNNTNGTKNSINYVETNVTNVYEAIKIIKVSNSFQVDVNYRTTAGTYVYQDYYTPNYIYSDLRNAEIGYIFDGQGIFRIDRYDDDLIASEYYVDENNSNIKDLYNSSIVSTYAQMDETNFEKATETTFTLTNKQEKLLLLDINQFESASLTSITSVTYTLSNNSLEGFKIDIQFSDGSYLISTFSNFNVAKSEDVENYLANGNTVASISEDLLRVKSLFSLNNYTRVCYENEDPTAQVIGNEYFLPNYFYGDYTVSEYVLYEKGYLALDKKEKNGTKYDGAYYFLLNDDLSAFRSFLGFQPAFTTNVKDMSYIMNYPSRLKMFDYNLQYFDEIGDDDDSTHTYVTQDTYIINDWISNFQISLETDDGESAYIYDLRIITNIKDNDEDCKVTFQFDYRVGTDTTVYGLQREFINFGASNIEVVDTFLDSFTSYTVE